MALLLLKFSTLLDLKFYLKNYGGSVGTATGYVLDDREIEVKNFKFPYRPDRSWGQANLQSNGYRGLCPRGKASGAWGWPLTSNYRKSQEKVYSYIHSPITPSWHST
jgi:hypothetical protein